MLKTCKYCRYEFETDNPRIKYCSKICGKLVSKEQNIKNRKKHIIKAKKIRNTLLKLKNNTCELCGYNKCDSALHFHHNNTEDKLFHLNGADLAFHTEDEIIDEFNKCRLVCANCHRLEHKELNNNEIKPPPVIRPNRREGYCIICTVKLKKRLKWPCCSIECRAKYNYILRKIGIFNAKKRGKEKRELILNLRGNKCSKCGYDKCTSALQFHHQDPALKKFELTTNNLKSKSLEDILIELDKTILLCACCHIEEHRCKDNLI